MKLLLGLLTGLMATTATAQKANNYKHDGLYPDFRKNGIMTNHVEGKWNFYVKNCVTVSKKPIDRICDVRVGNFAEEVPWGVLIIRETVWTGGRDMRMTWLFAAGDRAAVIDALDGHFGPMPAEIAQPDTWCAFQGVFTLESAPEGVLVRFVERMSDGREWMDGICGTQVATREQQDALAYGLYEAQVDSVIARSRVGR